MVEKGGGSRHRRDGGVPQSLMAESFQPAHRVRRREDYLRAYREGVRLFGRFSTLHVSKKQDGGARLGITASRKVGKAVVRQKLKRRVREVFRRLPERGTLGNRDIVVHLKPGAGEASFDQLAVEMTTLLKRAGRGEGKAPRRRSQRR
ncbi:MAG: ribonuclease P protein component [Acidobacteriota bacterium]